MNILFAWLISVVEHFYFFKFIAPWDAGIRVRAGHFNRVVTGGTWFKFPILDKFVYMNIKRQVLDFPTQVITSADQKALAVSAWCVYAVDDPKKVWMDVQDHDDAISTKGMDLIAEYISEMDAEDCDRESLIQFCEPQLKEWATHWGCAVEEFGVTDLAVSKVFRLIQDTAEMPEIG